MYNMFKNKICLVMISIFLLSSGSYAYSINKNESKNINKVAILQAKQQVAQRGHRVREERREERRDDRYNRGYRHCHWHRHRYGYNRHRGHYHCHYHGRYQNHHY